MPRIAVLGANGQVGAELCLLLRRTPGIALVPVCRNPTGSAFLRYSGVACRHGRPADSREAPGLFGDCDVIVNCALGSGTPGETRAFDRKLIRNIFAHSKPDAIVIHCSTLMVHGDPRPGKLRRARDAYSRAKYAAEGFVDTESKRSGKRSYVLRLGHVCGPLQNITAKIHREIASRQVVLPEDDLPSNTVYTVTLVDAIASILAGNEPPGTYDLTNAPQWTWREVYAYESAQCRQLFVPQLIPSPKTQGLLKQNLARARRTLSGWARTSFVRRTLERWLALAPTTLNDHAQATWLRMRARAEIGAISAGSTPAPELTWISLDRRRLTSLQPTASLLAKEPYKDLTADIRGRWPKDLGLAVEVPGGAVAQEQA
jgi:nucleoside-diphosphate-sugar epimerase